MKRKNDRVRIALFKYGLTQDDLAEALFIGRVKLNSALCFELAEEEQDRMVATIEEIARKREQSICDGNAKEARR